MKSTPSQPAWVEIRTVAGPSPIHEKAAALLHGLARNHPFVTGNKRTAWTATAMFYMVNGYNLPVDSSGVIGLTTDAAGRPTRCPRHRGHLEGLGTAIPDL